MWITAVYQFFQNLVWLSYLSNDNYADLKKSVSCKETEKFKKNF